MTSIIHREARFACPRCGAPAMASDRRQKCTHCGRAFLMRAGAMSDPKCTPQIFGYTTKVPTREGFARTWALLTPDEVATGARRGIVGVAPKGDGIPYGEITSIRVWKRVGVAQILISLPIFAIVAGFLALGSWGGAAMAGFAAFGNLFAGLLFGPLMVSISSPTRQLSLVLHAANRGSFLRELFRRAGISPSP